MKIWLDLANSPQVLFFRPLLTELRQCGHDIEVTTRAYAQTTQLADQLGFRHTIVGQHGGRTLWGLIRQNYLRALLLAYWARSRHFDLAVSHNSYSQVVAAALLRLPSVTLMDYEHQPLNHLCFRLASRVIVPEAFPPEYLRKFGAARKTWMYPGVKEQVYLANFTPEPNFRRKCNLPLDVPLAVVRPPAPWTAYHRFENDVFDDLLVYLASHPQLYVLFLPRIASQVDSVRHLPGIHTATQIYDGPNLLSVADLVISGGGTMNREAAVLGTPTYTIFKGELGAVDRFLIQQGRMTQLQTMGDFSGIEIVVHANHQPMLTGQSVVTQIADHILDAIPKNRLPQSSFGSLHI